MPRGMRAELKGLSSQMAAVVGAHLMMAGQLIDSDPELAYRHAEAARRRAARLPITREATAEAAYAAGKYEEALAQYRASRRMTGNHDVIPVMVDCLRALGRHRDALELAEEGRRVVVDPAMAIELVIVTAGVRVDLDQTQEGLRLLRREIEQPTVKHPRLARARLLYAFADLLARTGDMDNAYKGFAMAARLDPDGTTAALDRLDELDGVVLTLDESEFLDDEAEEADESEDADDLDRESGDADESERADDPAGFADDLRDRVDDPEGIDDSLAADEDLQDIDDPSDDDHGLDHARDISLDQDHGHTDPETVSE